MRSTGLLRGISTVAVWLVAVVAVSAQAYDRGYFVTGSGGVAYVDPAGSVTTAAFGTTDIYGATLGPAGREIYAHDPSNFAISRIDPVSLTVLGTLHQSFTLFASPFGAQTPVIGEDGDLYFASLPEHAVLRLDRASQITTVIAAQQLGQPFYSPRNLAIDPESGDLLVADGQPQLIGPALYRLAQDGSKYTTVGTGFDFRYGIVRDPNTGDIYSGSCCGTGTGGRSLEVLRSGQTTPSVFLDSPTLTGAYGVALERSSAATRRLFVAARQEGATEGLWTIDLQSAQARKLATLAIGSTYGVVPLESRTITWTETGPNRWDIDVWLRDPNWFTKQFMIALGASGTRPGVPLTDGRRIPLNFDGLTIASISGALGPLLTGNIGTIPSSGHGTAKLDLRSLSLPPGFALTAWACVVVLDRAAPLGIALVSDPAVRRLKLN